jgi:hypothetical protein
MDVSMFQRILAAAIVASMPAAVSAQSASAPLVITAAVVSTCKVDVPHSAEPSLLTTLPITVTCARRGAAARVQRPQAPRRSAIQDAVLTIDF